MPKYTIDTAYAQRLRMKGGWDDELLVMMQDLLDSLPQDNQYHDSYRDFLTCAICTGVGLIHDEGFDHDFDMANRAFIHQPRLWMLEHAHNMVKRNVLPRLCPCCMGAGYHIT